MNPELKARCSETLKVRRVTVNADSASSETLGSTTTLTVYRESGTRVQNDGAGGLQHVPYHLIILDAADYSPTEEDRWFLPGVDVTVPENGLRWRGPACPFLDDANDPSHWEIEL